MTQHTATPWDVKGQDALSKAYLVDHQDGLIEVYGANREANARLVAAAPALLMALENLLEDALADGILDGTRSGVVAEAKAAIKRAKG